MAVMMNGSMAAELQRVAAPSLLEVRSVAASGSASMVEIIVSWGDSILHVAHLQPTQQFWVGELERPRRKRAHLASGGGKVDFMIDADLIGARHLPLLLNEDGKLWFIIPRGASGELELAGARIDFDELKAQGLLHPVTGVLGEGTGARKFPLARGARAHVDVGALRLSIRWVAAAQPVGVEDRSAGSCGGRGWILASAVIHAALLAILHWLPAEPRLLESMPMADANDHRAPVIWLTRGG
jgi:hypothetical protein